MPTLPPCRKWAIHNVKSIKPLGEREWEIQTPRGAGRLIPRFYEPYGILDREFIDPKEGSWSVSARVAPVGASASAYMITLTKPEAMPEEVFVQGMTFVEDELRTLKQILES